MTGSADIDGLDMEAFSRLQRRTLPSPHKTLYFDYETQIGRAFKRAENLGLAASSSGLHVLDIGTGPGYFLFACEQLGHRAVGIDPPGYRFIRGFRRILGLNGSVNGGLRDWLGVTCIEYAVRAQEKLPVRGRFDLVTSWKCPFNYVPAEHRLWTLDEWAFFLDHMRDDVLNPGGRVVFNHLTTKTTPNKRKEEAYDADFVAFLKARGAAIDGTRISFDSLR